jgi:hypothetical protein
MVDITFATSEDMSEVVFSASTSKGEQWMGAPQVTKPLDEAKDYQELAEAEGLIVKPFP